jgi:hypothetical protein
MNTAVMWDMMTCSLLMMTIYRVIHSQRPRIRDYKSQNNLPMNTRLGNRCGCSWVTEEDEIGFPMPGEMSRHGASCSLSVAASIAGGMIG